jgi:hypothetical protein
MYRDEARPALAGLFILDRQNQSADARQGVFRVAGIAKCKTLLHAYAEIISTKGSTAHQKNINTRNGWKRNPRPSKEV